MNGHGGTAKKFIRCFDKFLTHCYAVKSHFCAAAREVWVVAIDFQSRDWSFI